MRIFIDGDSCPVKEIVVDIGKMYSIKVIIVTSINHYMKEDKFANIIYVDAVSQEADLVIANKVKAKDIVVTDDYGLASLVIQKGSYCIASHGYIFSLENIDRLLLQRHIVMKQLKSGHKVKKTQKRKKNDDHKFRRKLIEIIEQLG